MILIYQYLTGLQPDGAQLHGELHLRDALRPLQRLRPHQRHESPQPHARQPPIRLSTGTKTIDLKPE